MDLDVALPFEVEAGPARRGSAGTAEPTPARRASGPQPHVEVRRSARRRRTVSAYREGDRVVVLVPARFTRAEESRWDETMMQRLAASEAKRRPSDTDLASRAEALSTRFLQGRAKPASIRWVANQRGRWGSCTPSERTIRISSRVQGMPGYVLDYVILHELGHLLVAGHGPDFWALLQAYPKLDRARGYLDGVAAASGLALSDD
jgi:predicted metal-dependent hydrolase